MQYYGQDEQEFHIYSCIVLQTIFSSTQVRVLTGVFQSAEPQHQNLVKDIIL